MHHLNTILQEHPYRIEPFQRAPFNNDNSAIEDEYLEEMIDRFCGEDFGAETMDNMDSRIEDDDPTMQKL